MAVAGGESGPLSGFVTAPAKPNSEFQVSAVVLSLVPSANICAFAVWHRAFAAALDSHTLVSWSQIRLVMISKTRQLGQCRNDVNELGLRASSWPWAQRGSIGRNVNSVAAPCQYSGSQIEAAVFTWTPIKSSLKFHGRHAETEVDSCNC